jgi:CRP/FNR family transcriptional regulator, cyclic AMP receptor protein
MIDPVAENDASGAETFLQRLSDLARMELFAIGTRRRYPSGATLFFEGDPAHEALVILDGQIKAVVLATGGREVILDVLGPGSLLGELAAIDAGPRSASALALTQVEVLAVSNGAFDEYLLEHPAVLRDLAVVVVTRLRDSDRRQLEFGTEDSLGRLCIRIVELAKRYGRTDADGRIQIESPLSQGDLAAWSGLSREAVVKSMRKLRDLGWIENKGPSITLLQPELIQARAAGI